jgi:NAD(P)-dependent dehydrogenase (short-subunit alcohol dehydrogenase family)
MKILLTGSEGLAAAIVCKLPANYTVNCVSRATGNDILNINQWGSTYIDHDTVINCAYNNWGQVQVLQFFYNAWKHNQNKTIINVGSIVTDYAQSEKHLDFKYSEYRLHKQTLQLAFQKMSRDCECNIKLINPGPIDTDMVKHLQCNKLSTNHVAERICWLLHQPDIKRLDLWV